MKWAVLLVVALAFVGAGCDRKTPPKQSAPPAGKGSSGNPLTAPVDYLGAVGAAQKQAARFADITPVQQAVRAFQAGEDRLPANLQELVSEGYIPKLPSPPKGMALAYNPGTGQVKFVPSGQPPAAPGPR